MKNTLNSTVCSLSEQILKKIKKLKVDTIYSTASLGSADDKVRVYISRLADRGVIVKCGRGKFYKPTSKTIYKKSNKYITLNKSIFTNDLFWSVSDGFKVESDGLIKAYLIDWNEDDLMALYSLFGYERLLSMSLKLYKVRINDNYKRIRKVLQRLEEWRLDDKRS